MFGLWCDCVALFGLWGLVLFVFIFGLCFVMICVCAASCVGLLCFVVIGVALGLVLFCLV